MDKIEKLEDFYQRKFDFIPDNLRREIGHFNIFKLDPFVGKNAKPVPYKRRDFYKVMLVKGGGRVHYADKVVDVQKQVLSFSNPQIPYKWEHTEDIVNGVYCIFDRHFFEGYGKMDTYSVFQPQGEHIFELTDQQVEEVAQVYERMLQEIQSDYPHKYDVLRNLVSELVHYAMKLKPVSQSEVTEHNASQRITTLFMELLERQFPIDEDHQKVRLRSASDFADQLSVHVNHLNRAIKETTQKTTTEIITERLLKESKVLLKHSNWNVAEIAYALNFKEATHFSNFFKKQTLSSPSHFRKS
jgi:AraC-like DNA-binding protein